ncbi:GNAT family N-acetyltransferase [Erwinia pyri]|uniref:GNAT family N-acetyltransferase n=2 Tax=Erwinia pyri TaxID=3062598 RepID=A0AA50DL55_9GAMM|nr:GNAT family N-acetyltransferase [Erwinia sp. DE2]WLS80024.1 GNAT family N-acetyltransferase [Erwinia sp. DE2]
MHQMVLSTNACEPAVDWQALADLIERAGLSQRDPEVLKRAYQHSQFVWFGYVRGKLMATAHAISDLTYASYLSDVIVDAAWQGQGYGGQLMEAIMKTLAPCGKVFIYSMPDKIGFYQKLGYASLTTGMIYAEGKALLRLQEKGFVTR